MTTLVYIAGLSRSGSTLLELLLGSHPGIVTVGELQILPHELRSDARIPCGCGEQVDRCPFWAAVVARVDPRDAPAPQLDAFREHHGWGSTIRPARLREFGPRPPDPALRRQIAQYGRNTAELVEAIADVAGERSGERPSVVVDASKDPYRALWLARSGAVDLRLVHLVRDPHGSVHSLTRDRRDPVRRDVAAFRRTVAWEVENHLVRRLRTSVLAADRSVLVRYEDLATDPLGQLGTVLALLGRVVDPTVVDRFRSTSVHTVAGNPMRADRRPIALDERWRTELAPSTRSIVDAVARGRRRYGYD